MRKRKISKNLRRKITFMVIPHHAVRPMRINISLRRLLVVGLAIFFTVGINLFIATRHIDYVREKIIKNNFQKERAYYTQEVIKTRGMAADLEVMQNEIKNLLDLKPAKTLRYSGRGNAVSENNLLKDNLLTKREFEQNVVLLNAEVERQKKDFTAIKNTPLIWPAEGRITSGYGYRSSPFFHRTEFHAAVDIANVAGTPIKAPADGIVIGAGWNAIGGNFLIIHHGNIDTKFDHCRKLLVKKGARVSRGQIIALMGSSGLVTGSHLHYQVLVGGVPVNPLRYMCFKTP